MGRTESSRIRRMTTKLIVGTRTRLRQTVILPSSMKETAIPEPRTVKKPQGRPPSIERGNSKLETLNGVYCSMVNPLRRCTSRILMTLILASGAWLGAAQTSSGSDQLRLDLDFGSGGSIVSDLGPGDRASPVPSRALYRYQDGRILFATSNSGIWTVKRYLADGSPDPDFGDSGSLEIVGWGYSKTVFYNSSVTSVVVRPDGRILLSGFVQDGMSMGNLGPPAGVFAQLLPDGSPDQSFGQFGGTSLLGYGDAVAAIDLGPDGRIVAAGYTEQSTTGRGDDGLLMRFTEDGRLDRAFGRNGRVVIPGERKKNSYLLDVHVFRDGQIVAAGAKSNRYLLAKFNSRGRPSFSFGKKGRVVIEVDRDRCSCELGRAMTVDGQGRITVTGHVNPPKRSEAIYGATVRVTRSGELDKSFGRQGVARTHLGTMFRPLDVSLTKSLAPVLVGELRRAGIPSRAVSVQFRKNGSVRGRPQFLQNSERSSAWAVVGGGFGRLLVGGHLFEGANEKSFLKRLKP